MEVTLHKGSEKVQISEAAFSREFNEPLVHQVLVAYMAATRAGTRGQKNRAAVSGGGSKPWRQKGTGRARAGTTRGPLWRGGGVTFAAKPQNHAQKVNKKMYRGAMCSILSELLRQQRLLVVDAISIDAPKTKQLASRLKELGVSNALIVTESDDLNLYLAARNMRHVDVLDAAALNPLDLLRFEQVLITVDSLKRVEGMLA